MAFLSIIRRWHKREQVPIREISRRLGVSRNTIRKYLRSPPFNACSFWDTELNPILPR
jgi:IS30 family transposase